MPSGIEELAAHYRQQNASRTPARRPATTAGPAAPPRAAGVDFAGALGQAVGAGVQKALAAYAASKKQQAAAEASRLQDIRAAGQASIQAPIQGPGGPAQGGMPGGVQWGPQAQQYWGGPQPAPVPQWGPPAPPQMPMAPPQPQFQLQMPGQLQMPPGMPFPGPGQ